VIKLLGIYFNELKWPHKNLCIDVYNTLFIITKRRNTPELVSN
jgi:hypothetical protein